MNNEPQFDLSVIFPLVDPRGDPVERVRSWSSRQTLPRERFQIIAVSDGSNLDVEEKIAPLLAPQDRLLRRHSDNVMELYEIGLRNARGRLLVFSELHCMADAHCLAEVADYFRRHDVAGAVLNTQTICSSDIARCNWEVCDKDLPRTLPTEHWNKVMLRGFAIYRDVLLAAGGLEFSHRAFAEFALGAKLNTLGHRLGYAERAQVEHFDNISLPGLLGLIRSFACGEISYFATHDAEHCSRYFGHLPEWAERHLYLPEVNRTATRELWRSLQNELLSPGCRFAIVRVLATAWLQRFGASVTPCCLRLAVSNLAILAARIRFFCWRGHNKRRMRAHLDTRSRTVHHERLKWILQHGSEESTAATFAQEYHLGEMPPAHLIGFHAPEEFSKEKFRWSGPAALMRLDLPPGDYDVTLATRSLRAASWEFPLALFFNGHKVSHKPAAGDPGQLGFSVSRRIFAPDSPQWLTIACQALEPQRAGIADSRSLGLPVFSVKFVGARAAKPLECAAV